MYFYHDNYNIVLMLSYLRLFILTSINTSLYTNCNMFMESWMGLFFCAQNIKLHLSFNIGHLKEGLNSGMVSDRIYD